LAKIIQKRSFFKIFKTKKKQFSNRQPFEAHSHKVFDVDELGKLAGLCVGGGVAIAVGVTPGTTFATGRGHVQQSAPLVIEGILILLMMIGMISLHPARGHIGTQDAAHKGL